MVLSDSQLSMRTLCSEFLFTPVVYIFVTCLTKCLSWLVWVQSTFHSSIVFSTVISMLFYYYEGVMKFWAVIRALGLKKCLKSRGCWNNTKKFSLWALSSKPVRANLGF